MWLLRSRLFNLESVSSCSPTTTGGKRFNGAAVGGGGQLGRGNVRTAAVSRLVVILIISLDDNGCLIEGDSFRAGKRDKLVPGVLVFFTWRM